MGTALGLALEWVVEQHLDRVEDELNQLQADYEDVLRKSKNARERKFDQEHIVDLYQQLESGSVSTQAPEGPVRALQL
jgi:hypothetical protein